MNFKFGNFNASPSCRTPTPTNYSDIFKPYESCSYCSNPHHQVENCQYIYFDYYFMWRCVLFYTVRVNHEFSVW
jgi:hypothetical protein